MRELVLCGACRRHVRREETKCPFCASDVQAPARSSIGITRPLSRAAIYVTTTMSLACEKKDPGPAPIGPAPSDKTPAVVSAAPSASEAPMASATPSATATATATAKGLARGASCTGGQACAAGLSCCQTGMQGKCGGAHQAGVKYPPCVITSTCEPGPCRPLPMPPYGCVFPCDDFVSV